MLMTDENDPYLDAVKQSSQFPNTTLFIVRWICPKLTH